MSTASNNKGLKGLDFSVLQQCIHCGMCLPSCPTYNETLLERNSPRGRISLMRAVAEDEISLDEAFADEMYYCLGCLSCTSACPAGVDYAKMFETARDEVESNNLIEGDDRRFWRWFTLRFLFMRPRILKAFGWALRIYQQSGLQACVRKSGLLRALPENLRKLEPSTPVISSQFSDSLIKNLETPSRLSRYKIGLLTGCVQDLAFSDINSDTVDVLKANDCQVVTPRNQVCCGSLHAHNGELELAKALAKKTIDSFDIDSLDAIISNAGGCGSHLKHYSELLKDDEAYSDRAKLWDSKLKDIHQWLFQIDLKTPPELNESITGTYHPSCHLHHGQKVKDEPIALLQKIPGLTLIPLPQADSCCGSAGIYNITHPELSAKLQTEKVLNIDSTKASIILTANPGCHLQIQNGLAPDGRIVMHPISLLAQAYRNGHLAIKT